MRWVLQTPRIWEQETTQPNQPKQTKISPGKRSWDMPTSLSNSVLEIWTLADLSLVILTPGRKTSLIC
jgi:hypothetical protein